ncbi:hypothetical protein ACQKWADRAFT_305233 [Trichoderma austrokoningii]
MPSSLPVPSTQLVGSMPFETNKVEAGIDGEAASARRVDFYRFPAAVLWPAATSTSARFHLCHAICHAQDQANTVVHESTYLSQVKGTQGYGGYGYNFIQPLSASQNIDHADTYALRQRHLCWMLIVIL